MVFPIKEDHGYRRWYRIAFNALLVRNIDIIGQDDSEVRATDIHNVVSDKHTGRLKFDLAVDNIIVSTGSNVICCSVNPFVCHVPAGLSIGVYCIGGR